MYAYIISFIIILVILYVYYTAESFDAGALEVSINDNISYTNKAVNFIKNVYNKDMDNTIEETKSAKFLIPGMRCNVVGGEEDLLLDVDSNNCIQQCKDRDTCKYAVHYTDENVCVLGNNEGITNCDFDDNFNLFIKT